MAAEALRETGVEECCWIEHLTQYHTILDGVPCSNLRRNVRQIKTMIDNQRERGDEISPKYIRLSYHTEVTPRVVWVVKRGRAAAALNYMDTEATPLFDDSRRVERWATNADDGRRHHQKGPPEAEEPIEQISSSRKGVGRHDPPALLWSGCI
jgi:hypothetical protein